MKLRGFLKNFCTEAYETLVTMNEIPRPPYNSPIIAGSVVYSYPLSKMSSYKQLQHYMDSSGLFEKLNDVGHRWFWHEGVFHWLFLERVLAESWGTSLDEKVFERVYNRAKAEISRPTFTVRRIAVLHGVPQVKRRLNICPGVYLISVELQKSSTIISNLLWHRYQDKNREPSLWVDPNSCLFIQDRVIKKGEEGKELLKARAEIKEQAQLVIKALRLSVDSPVHHKATFTSYLSTFPLLPIDFEEVEESRDFSIEVERDVTRKERQDIRTYFSFVTQSESQEGAVEPFFLNALDRYNGSFRLRDIKQSIVDLNVALESLFQVKGELRYRLAVSVASLLGTNDKDRSNLLRKIYAGYRLRNAIVHGRKNLAESMSKALKEFFPELEGKSPTQVNRQIGKAVRELQLIVRQALRAYIYMRTNDAQVEWPPLAEYFVYLLFDLEKRHEVQKQLGIKNIREEVSKVTYWQSLG